MTNVLYIPLDERACNYRFPQQLAQMTGSIRLLTPPESIMGYRKNPADCEALWQWLFDHVQQCEYAILSVDTLVYGNILNSRLHHRTIEDCERLLDNFRKLKSMNPSLEIHAFSIVARVAAYNGSMEDPDYWETHGRDIWRYTILRDKLSRGESTAEERKEYTELVALIPAEYLNDFLARRKVDRAVNLACVDLTHEGVFEMLTIPKDDTAEYGYAALDQMAISEKIREHRLMGRVLVYPGADELGCVLLARVFCRIESYTPRIYVRYSSTLGPFLIPIVEDRPLHEGIKAQITSLGGIVEDSAADSDCMLAVHSPGKEMIDSCFQDHKDLTFTSHINTDEFIRYINDYIDRQQKAVGVADVAFINGSDKEFMDYLLTSGTLHRIQSVGGWNTAMNTVGVVLAQTVIAACRSRFEGDYDAYHLSEEFKMHHVVQDWLFQADALQTYFAAYRDKIDVFNLREHYNESYAFIGKELHRLIDEKFRGKYKGADIVLENLGCHWDGAQYIRFDLHLDGIRQIWEQNET